MSRALRTAEAISDDLIEHALLDRWPGPEAVDQFGIESDEHWDVLCAAVKSGDLSRSEAIAACGRPSILQPKLSQWLGASSLPTFSDPSFAITAEKPALHPSQVAALARGESWQER